MTSLYAIDRDGVDDVLGDEPRFRAEQLWRGLYERCVPVQDMTDIPTSLRARLEQEVGYALGEAAESATSDGDTVKWLWTLRDGTSVETVLMHYDNRSTACVSSQAGCAMGCTFCATGQGGFDRHLDSAEIVEQVVRAIWRARPRRLSNVVFMGMGEPLSNFDAVWAAIERIHDDLGISARGITVSTVGIVPGIRRLTAESLPVNLAVSLHAANNELRDQLVPINRQYPLQALLEACADDVAARNRRLSFEWAMIDGVNDRDSDAAELAELARALRAHVNLIPLNPTSGYGVSGTPPRRVSQFRQLLGDLGVNATVRRNRGTEIDAACGQLRARHDTAVPAPRRIRRESRS
jgi:23S rRNA (adenine2503-C2)-methyltransferase